MLPAAARRPSWARTTTMGGRPEAHPWVPPLGDAGEVGWRDSSTPWAPDAARNCAEEFPSDLLRVDVLPDAAGVYALLWWRDPASQDHVGMSLREQPSPMLESAPPGRVVMTKTCLASVALATALLGCYQSAPAAGDDVAGVADDGRDAGGDGDGDVDAGRWVSTVVLDETTAYGRLGATAQVFLRIDPPANDACGRVVEAFGDCIVETYTYPTCASACVGVAECIWDDGCGAGRCYGHMDSVSAGEVAITGATFQPDVHCILPDTNYYYCIGGGWPDLWNEGDTIRVSAPGDVFPPFHFELVAPADMTLSTDTDAWTTDTFDGSADVGLAWTASGGDRIHLQLQTGARDKLLTCDTTDDGSFAIPAAAIRSALGGPIDWYVLIVDRIDSAWWLPGDDLAVLGVAKSSLVVIIPAP